MTENVELPSILRTQRDGCFEKYTNRWGSFLRPIDDPDATVVITEQDLDDFELKKDIPRIPCDLWQRWIQLCFHFVDVVEDEVEVSVRILRSENDPSLYRFLVPEQKVSSVDVEAPDFNKAVDIETGEEITSYPPIGWIPIGSSHSHNTMPTFFSSTDDKYELGDPGIHIVVGAIDLKTRKYQLSASVVSSGRRFLVPYGSIIDTTPVDNCTFNNNVLKYVDYTPPIPVYKNTPKTNT
jgi:hypothetical protein